MREDTFKAMLLTLIISALLAVAFIFFMRYKIARQDVFSELYFERPDNLPQKLKLNETYNISFVITNNELEENTYFYEIVSKIKNITKNITLSPNERVIISLSVTPEDKGWVLNFTSEQEFEDGLTSLDSAFIAADNDFRMIVNNKSMKHFLPISHNLPVLGQIFHTNLSIEELKQKPFNKIIKENETSEETLHYRLLNITLYVKDDEVHAKIHEKMTFHITQEEPFTIKLYKEATETEGKQEIYFWYEITS